MTDNLFFIADCSEWQNDVIETEVAANGFGLIVRTNYGTRPDKMVAKGRVAAARAAGLPSLGFYIFLLAEESITLQVAAMVSILGPTLAANEWVMVDWEHDPGNGTQPSVQQRDQALELLEAMYLRPTVLYVQASTLRTSPSTAPTIVASYQTKEPSEPHVAWQFTNGVYISDPYPPKNVPGIGYCDLSVYHGTAAQFNAAIGLPTASPTPAPEEMPMKFVQRHDGLIAQIVGNHTEGLNPAQWAYYVSLGYTAPRDDEAFVTFPIRVDI
jgi:Glycosyl hydrolases family 25